MDPELQEDDSVTHFAVVCPEAWTDEEVALKAGFLLTLPP